MIPKTAKGFTLIELLVVIAVIGVLAAVILLAINPAELLRKARDSTRLQETTNLRKGIDAIIATQTASVLESIESTNSCTFANPCNSTVGNRSVDGTGWLPIALAEYFPVLPIDPLNNQSNVKAANGALVTPKIYFATQASAYRIAIYLESAQNVALLSNDGGSDNNIYEVGTNLTSPLTLN